MKAFVRVCVSVMALLLAAPALADVPLPDTPAGRMMGLWLDAFNSGNTARIQAFHHAYAPQLEARRDIDFAARTGGFEVLKVEQSEPLHITALVRERESDTVGRFDLAVTAGDKPQVAGLGIGAIPTPPEFAVVRLNEADAVAALGQRVDHAAAADRFSGQVLVAKNGHILFERAAGYADRDAKTPVTAETRFHIGSMNKMFTAVATLQLVDQGKISLDAPLGAYLTTYPNADTAKVTIRQLLTHTGGTGDIFGPDFDQHHADLETLDDYIALYGQRAPAFTPGERFDYSNYGFILLGAVVEKVSGQSYYDYVEAHIFQPAGMTHSGSLPEDAAVPGLSAGYMHSEAGWISNAATLPYRGTSAGGGYSTAGDLLNFAEALRGGKLLSPASLALATGVQTQTQWGGDYGFGFEVDPSADAPSYGHGGGAPGMNGYLRIYPKSGYVVVALSNFDPPAAQKLTDYVSARLPAEEK